MRRGLLNLPVQPELDINAPFTWKEICDAMNPESAFKAAGPSGMQAAWLQVAKDTVKPGTPFPTIPTSRMGRCLLTIVNAMWCNAHIPITLTQALLISIHKDGPRTNPSNYRGISLLETLLKLICAALAHRLSSTLPLVHNQAGFRRREECSAHIATLLEACQRRKACHKKTYLLFIDLKKAFDTVPQAALFYKANCIGIRGRSLNFIRALYSSATTAILGNYGVTGEPIQIQQGVRQGCPLSPLLFNIFINDLPRALGKGINVPNVPIRVSSLLWADDAVALASSIAGISKAANRLEKWCVSNMQDCNLPKCALMVVNGNSTRLTNANICYKGSPIPVKTTYKYLGFPFNNNLCMKQAALARASTIKDSIAAQVRPFLFNNQIPLVAKLDVLRGVVAPGIAFGGEIIGMSQPVCAPLDSILNQLLRPLVKTWGRPASTPLRRELNIASVFSTMAAMRARAILKFPKLKSTVRYFTNKLNDLKTHATYWTKQSRQWLKRNITTTNQQGATPKEIAADIKMVVEGDLMRKDKAKGGKGSQYYFQSKFFLSRRYLAEYAKLNRTDLDTGITGLITARTGGLLTANKLAAAGKIDAHWRNACPCCNGTTKETMEHIIVECPAWDAERQDSKIGAIMDYLKEEFPSISARNLATIVIGGTVNMAIGGTASLDSFFYRRPVFIAGVATSPVYLLIATFFKMIHRRRQVLLWNTADRSPSPSGVGTPQEGY